MNSERDGARLERHRAPDDGKGESLAVGNWPSQQLLQSNKAPSQESFGGRKRSDEELSTFLEKRQRGELLIQKTARLYDNFLAPVQQQPMAERNFLAFGQIVQLIACDMPTIAGDCRPLTLSVVVNEPDINRCQTIDRHCELSCAPSTRILARNAFVLRRAIDRKIQLQNDADHLKYGEDFVLECHGCQRERPLLVYSALRNPLTGDAAAVKGRCGETKQSVGLAFQRSRESSAALVDDSIPNAFFHWRLLHVNPEMRYETIGENIPINAKVIVEHRSTRNNLCCESSVFSTIFGMECGVSCHTERNIYGVERASNVWRISTKSSEI